MIPGVELPEGHHLDSHAHQGGGGQGGEEPDPPGAGPTRHSGPHKGSHHVEGAVGQVDEIHDPEDEGQTRGHQEEHHAELQAVEHLLNDQEERHYLRLTPLTSARTCQRRRPGGPQRRCR